MRAVKYADLGSLAEDDRIKIITACINSGKKVSFIVETNEKADNYLTKLTAAGARYLVKSRTNGPIPDTISVLLEPKKQ